MNIFEIFRKKKKQPDEIIIIYFVHTDMLDKNWLGRLKASLSSLYPLPEIARFCLADYSSQPSVPASLLEEFSIDYLHHATPLPFNRSWSINYAYRQFKKRNTKWLLFSDIDLVFPPGFIRGAMTILEQKKAIVIPNVYYLHQDSSDLTQPYSKLKAGINSAWRRFFGGANLCPAELFEEVRGFDELYVGWGAEDNDFINRVKSVNGEVIKTEELEVLHLDHPRTGEQDTEQVARNRLRLALKENGEIAMIDDSPWGQGA